jgi:hypothetical protein
MSAVDVFNTFPYEMLTELMSHLRFSKLLELYLKSYVFNLVIDNRKKLGLIRESDLTHSDLNLLRDN